MLYAVVIARTLVGLVFFVFGLNYFLHFIPMPTDPPSPEAGLFMGALVPTQYMAAVKVIEIAGGAMLLVGRFVPLGITLVTPVAVNIAFWDIFLVHKPALGVVLTALLFFLVYGYRSSFRPVFAANSRIG